VNKTLLEDQKDINLGEKKLAVSK